LCVEDLSLQTFFIKDCFELVQGSWDTECDRDTDNQLVAIFYSTTSQSPARPLQLPK
jgi:hypothetical protein